MPPPGDADADPLLSGGKRVSKSQLSLEIKALGWRAQVPSLFPTGESFCNTSCLKCSFAQKPIKYISIYLTPHWPKGKHRSGEGSAGSSLLLAAKVPAAFHWGEQPSPHVARPRRVGIEQLPCLLVCLPLSWASHQAPSKPRGGGWGGRLSATALPRCH